MSDDNKFSLGDILWEYADYDPPEPPPTPGVPLPPEEPQKPVPPAAPVQPTIPSPQPVTPPTAQPAAPKAAPAPPVQPQPAPAAQPTQPQPAPPPVQPNTPPAGTPAPERDLELTPFLPQKEAGKAQPAQTAERPAQAAQPAQTAEQSAQPVAPGQPAQPAAPKAAPAPPVQPQPAQTQPGQTAPAGDQPTQAPDQGGPTAQPGQPGQESAQPQPGQPGEAQPQQPQPSETDAPGTETPSGETPPVETPPGGGETPPVPPGGRTQTGQETAGQEPFRIRRERKARPAPEVPPDAPAAQLASEYGQGLKSLKSRCVGAAVITCLLLALSFLESGLIPIDALRDVVPRMIYLPVSMALFVVVAVLCGDVLKNGLVQLTNAAPDGDTLALFAGVFTLADGISLLAFHLRAETIPFFAPCGLVLTFHLMGRYLTQAARYDTCRTAASVAQPYVVTQDPSVVGGQSAFRKWIGTPKGFGSQVRSISDGAFRFQRLTPVLLVACVVLSMITTVAHHQPRLAFWSLSALFSAAATLGAGMVFGLPMRILGKRLSKLGVALAGWPGALAGKGCKAATLGDYDVYPPGTVTLASARVFEVLPMDRTISYAASAVRASGSGLIYVFDRILRQEHGTYLGVEKLVIQENGLVGQIQGQQVLVGNSDFMSRMGVSLPQGVRAKDAVFCAVGGELAGMFALRYNLHPAILPSLRAMFAHKIHPVMVTRDFNLSPQRLRLRGRLPVDQIAFPDLQRRVILSGPDQTHSDRVVAVLCKEGLPPFAEAIIGAKRVRRAGKLAGWFVNVSACVGVLLTATLSSAGALSSMCAWNLALFLLLWFAPVLLISLWTKRY